MCNKWTEWPVIMCTPDLEYIFALVTLYNRQSNTSTAVQQGGFHHALPSPRHVVMACRHCCANITLTEVGLSNCPHASGWRIWRPTRYMYICNILKNKKFREELSAYFPRYDTGHIENDASNNSSIVACVFVTAITFVPSRCLATIARYTYRHTDWWEGFF
jgi:hypothetical protein